MPRMPDPAPLSRIGFNAALLSASSDYRAAGMHRYIVGLVGALAGEAHLELTAFVSDPRAREVLPASVRLRPIPRFARRPVGRIAWEQVGLPMALAREGLGLLHSPAYALPLASPVPAVVTVHDLSFVRLPWAFPRAKGAYLRLATRLAVRRARAIIAVSEFTRREILALLGADPARVHVVPNGVDPTLEPADPTAVSAYRAETGLPDHFILAVGTLQPRKNLAVLVEAYARLRQAEPGTPPIVVAGAPGWGKSDVGARAAALGLGEREVRLLGYVPIEALPLLYSAASVVACPSRYEGFGLPVAEAMACGAPVVVAGGSSLHAVAGAAGLVVGPDDVDGWAAALATVLGDPARARAMARAGRARAGRFTWERAARETAAVYREVLSTGPAAALEASRGA